MYLELNMAGSGYYDVYVNGGLDCVLDTLDNAIRECKMASCEEWCCIRHNGEIVWEDE